MNTPTQRPTLPPASDASAFDFASLANYVPRERTLVREGMTAWGALEFAHVCEQNTTRRTLDAWTSEDLNTLHDACMFAHGRRAAADWNSQQADELAGELAAKGLPLPSVWFYVHGHSYPGSRGYAAVIGNALVIL